MTAWALLGDPQFWVAQCLDSLQYAMLLFLIAAGLSVTFGLMNVINLAHGALYAAGAYLALVVAEAAGSFWLGLLAAPIGVAAIGAALYALLIDRLRGLGPMAQVLATFGLLFIALDLLRALFGPEPIGLSAAPIPGRIEILGADYPLYRLFIISLGLGAYLGLTLLLERSLLGARLRAAVDDAETARGLGIAVDRVFFTVFLIGAALAGLAGAAALPAFAAAPGMATEALVPSLAVVVLGGLGSLRGAFYAALLIGAIETFGKALAPSAASLLVYALLALVLLRRPEGLWPARAAEREA